MSESSSSTQPPARDRGLGRPAEFGKWLAEEEAAERAAELARRQLGTNAEPIRGTAGEPEVEPEVDLSSFLEQQRILDEPPALTPNDPVDEDDVEHTLAHISSGGVNKTIEWDEDLDALEREKATAEAIWGEYPSTSSLASSPSFRKSDSVTADLKTRFRASPLSPLHAIANLAPPLPMPDGSQVPPKGPKDGMQDFLDDLLA
ncbi:hypothetical protein B0H11DRAFT_2179383 [Mycena galericulata]|nr:hypothetical protein B0H11DRAFT_2179383 [Mycena galericulata]